MEGVHFAPSSSISPLCPHCLPLTFKTSLGSHKAGSPWEEGPGPRADGVSEEKEAGMTPEGRSGRPGGEVGHEFLSTEMIGAERCGLVGRPSCGGQSRGKKGQGAAAGVIQVKGNADLAQDSPSGKMPWKKELEL